MNSTPITARHFIDDVTGGSDSDTNPDDTPEYYQPISAVDYDDDEGNEHLDQPNSDEEHRGYHASDPQHNLPNGYNVPEVVVAENGVSSLRITGDVEQKSSDDEEDEEEEERMRAASDSAMLRAFREDESRRNAPLTAENAVRIMEAMRGISFGGLAPDWAEQVPEDRWIDQLRRLRQPQQSSSTVQN